MCWNQPVSVGAEDPLVPTRQIPTRPGGNLERNGAVQWEAIFEQAFCRPGQSNRQKPWFESTLPLHEPFVACGNPNHFVLVYELMRVVDTQEKEDKNQIIIQKPSCRMPTFICPWVMRLLLLGILCHPHYESAKLRERCFWVEKLHGHRNHRRSKWLGEVPMRNLPRTPFLAVYRIPFKYRHEIDFTWSVFLGYLESFLRLYSKPKEERWFLP